MLNDIKLRWLIAAGIVVSLLEVLSLSGTTFPSYIAIPLYSTIILALGYDVLYKGIIALLNFNFQSIKFLMTVAVAGAFYLGEYSEAAVVIVLFSLAEHLEDVGISISKSSLSGLVDQMPKDVFIKGTETPVDINSLKIGDIITVKPFQLIPLDGVVSGGKSFVDESSISGEPIPRSKVVGDTVFAATWNKQGILEVSVTKLQNETVFAKIKEQTFQALEHKAKTQKFIEKFSKYYTPTIIFLALFWTFIPWFFWNLPFKQGFSQALILLVIACPCALVISTPISIFSAIGAASQLGVVIKGGRYLEAIGRVTKMAFDKTRTLTYGKPVVTDVIPVSGKSREEVLSCAASVEIFSEHPLAESIMNAAKLENIQIHQVKNFESILGKGAKAECFLCQEKEHFVGNVKYYEDRFSVPSPIQLQIESLRAQGKTVMLLTTSDTIEGLIALQDEIKSEAKQAINELNQLKVESVILTGDHTQTAKSVAEKLGIKEYISDCLPEDKSQAVKRYQDEGHIVCMVGDGINDATALATADVSISMSGIGSDTAIDTASIVIMNEHLRIIPSLIELGRKTLSIIKFNTVFAITLKLLVIYFAITGFTNLALAIFADVGATIIVIFNSLRLLYPQTRK